MKIFAARAGTVLLCFHQLPSYATRTSFCMWARGTRLRSCATGRPSATAAHVPESLDFSFVRAKQPRAAPRERQPANTQNNNNRSGLCFRGRHYTHSFFPFFCGTKPRKSTAWGISLLNMKAFTPVSMAHNGGDVSLSLLVSCASSLRNFAEYPLYCLRLAVENPRICHAKTQARPERADEF